MDVNQWLMQISPSVIVALLAVVVASISAWVAYKNVHGWKPVAVATGQSIRICPLGRPYAVLSFEVWNRKKYPIVVRHIRLDAKPIEQEGVDWEDQGWKLQGESPSFGGHLIPASSSKQYSYDHFFRDPTDMFKLSLDLEIRVEYFDPVGGKELSLLMKHRFAYDRPPRILADF